MSSRPEIANRLSVRVRGYVVSSTLLIFLAVFLQPYSVNINSEITLTLLDLVLVVSVLGYVVNRTPEVPEAVRIDRDSLLFISFSILLCCYVLLSGALLSPNTLLIDTILRVVEMLIVGFIIPYFLIKLTQATNWIIQWLELISVFLVTIIAVTYVLFDLSDIMFKSLLRSTCMIFILYGGASLVGFWERSEERSLLEIVSVPLVPIGVYLLQFFNQLSEMYAAVIGFMIIVLWTIENRAFQFCWVVLATVGGLIVLNMQYQYISILFIEKEIIFNDVTGRLFMIVAGIDVFLQNPFIGVGWGKTASMSGDKFLLNTLFARQPERLLTQGTHNLYVKILAELGLLGMGLFLVTIWYQLRIVYSGLFAPSESTRATLFAGGMIISVGVYYGINRFSAGSALLFFGFLATAILAGYHGKQTI